MNHIYSVHGWWGRPAGAIPMTMFDAAIKQFFFLIFKILKIFLKVHNIIQSFFSISNFLKIKENKK